MNLHATKGRSKAPATSIASSSDKVKEMASFLSIQLLEKVMSEAMKPEGESTLDIEAVERITQALQTTNQSSLAETSTPTFEETSDSPSLEERAPKEATDPTLSESVAVERESEDTPVPETVEGDSVVSAEQTELTETIQEIEEKVTAPTPEPVASTPQIPEIARKPLEVVESNIPPLRPESVPQRTTPIAEHEPAEEETIEDEVVVAATPEEVEEEKVTVEEIIAEEETSPGKTSEPEESAEEELARKKAQELFHRKLLQRKLEFDKKAAEKRIETEREAESSNNDDDDDDTEEDTQKGESTITSTDSTVEPPQIEPESHTEKTPNISELERRVETILALRQPKSTDQESRLAEKYSQMENLEDRAYTLLVDLGMIQEHQDPRDPSYDHSNDDDLCDQRYFPRM